MKKQPLYNRENFIKLLNEHFPEVVIDEYSEELLHCEMSAFRRYTEEAMKNEQEWKAEQCFQMIYELWKNADPDLENAISVSYIEELTATEYSENKKKIIFERMPKELLTHFLELAPIYSTAPWNERKQK